MEVVLRERGRVTIPAPVRKALGLRQSDKLTLEPQGGVIILKPREAVTAKELRGILGRHKVNIEETETAFAEEP